MKYKPIQGIDYLQNHYAVLELERTASQEDITKAFRKKIQQYHPDVLARAAHELQQQGREKSEILMLANNILSDEQRRAAYDKKLSEFDPELISEDGNPPKAIEGRRCVNIEYLIQGGYYAIEDAAGWANAVSGFNEFTFKLIEEQFKNTQNPPLELKRAYRGVLVQKYNSLGFMEDVEWDNAGVSHQESTGDLLFYPTQHVDKRLEQIAQAKEEIIAGVQKRVLALSSGEIPKLLLPSGDYQDSTKTYDANELAGKLTEHALKNFDSHTSQLETIAREKAQLMDKILELSEWRYIPPNQPITNRLIVLGEFKDQVIWQTGWEMTGDRIDLTPENYGFLEMNVKDLQSNPALEKLVKSGINVALIHLIGEIRHFTQVGYVVRQHFPVTQELNLV